MAEIQKKENHRHMVQISHGAYEKLRTLAFENRRTLKAQLDIMLKINIT